MAYTCSIDLSNSKNLKPQGDLRRFYGGAVQSDGWISNDPDENYAWKSHSFGIDGIGLQSLRSPAGSNVYVLPYHLDDKDKFITGSDEFKGGNIYYAGPDFLGKNIKQLEDLFLADIQLGYNYPIIRTIGTCYHFGTEIVYSLSSSDDRIQLANEPPNNHVFYSASGTSLENFTLKDPSTISSGLTASDINATKLPFFYVTGSDSYTLTDTEQGKTNTFYSYETWCNQEMSKSVPIQLKGQIKGSSIKNNKPKPSQFEFHTTHPFFYKYLTELSESLGFTNLKNAIGQKIIWEQLSDSWNNGNLIAGGISSTAKYKPNGIDLVTSSATLGADLLDVYLYHSESLATAHQYFPGAEFHFTEWKNEPDNFETIIKNNPSSLPGYLSSASLNAGSMLLSMARLRYEAPNLRALTYQSAWSTVPTSMVYLSGSYPNQSNDPNRQWVLTPVGEVYKTFKPAFIWNSKYIETPMIGGIGTPLSGPNSRPRNVMVEAFIPHGASEVLVCWVNNTGSGESIDVQIIITGSLGGTSLDMGTLTLSPFSYGSQSYNDPDVQP